MPPSPELDALFQLPLSEFTAARNALAKQRKGDGDSDGAAAIKALSKPSVSAWLVNRLWWIERELFDALLVAGDAVRDAAVRGAGPAEQREPAAQRKQALLALMRAAEQHLTDAGHGTSTATLRRITTTLEACAAYGTAVPDPGPGRLSDDMAPPGFAVLAGLAGLPTRPSAERASATSEPEGPSAGDRALAAVPEPGRPSPEERAAEALAEATTVAATRSAAVDAATRDADGARLQLERLQEAYEALEHTAVAARRAADEAKREADKAQRAANEADAAVLTARSRADEARRDVARLREKAGR